MSPEFVAGDIVLVVDDSPETLNFLTEALEIHGITALVARSGQNALSLLERISPDAILMDALMPDMDGFETCRRIRSKREFLHVPIIFMTGLSETEHVVKGFKAGGVDYVTKPVDPDEMLARIRAHIAGARRAKSAHIALDRSGSLLMAVTSQGEVLWATPRAQSHIKEILGAYDPQIEKWRATVTPGLKKMIAEPAAPAARAEIHGGLSLSYLGEAAPGEFLFGLNASPTSNDNEILRQRWGLTEREAEVLLWIAQGKPNRDIAAILKCRPRTVNKHLEQIFTKLGVENRTAAATIAIRILFSR